MVNPKVTAATAGGALSVILIWVLGALGADVPAEVASAITTLIAFVAGYAQPSPDEYVIEDADDSIHALGGPS